MNDKQKAALARVTTATFHHATYACAYVARGTYDLACHTGDALVVIGPAAVEGIRTGATTGWHRKGDVVATVEPAQPAE